MAKALTQRGYTKETPRGSLFSNLQINLSFLNLIFDCFSTSTFAADLRYSINIVAYVGSWNLFAAAKGSLTNVKRASGHRFHERNVDERARERRIERRRIDDSGSLKNNETRCNVPAKYCSVGFHSVLGFLGTISSPGIAQFRCSRFNIWKLQYLKCWVVINYDRILDKTSLIKL